MGAISSPCSTTTAVSRLLGRLALGAAALAAAPQVLALEYSDGSFAADAWMAIDVVKTGDATAEYLPIAASENFGNPGAMTLMRYLLLPPTFAPQNDTRIANIATGFIYDPAAQGALDTVSFALDYRGVGTTFSFASMGGLRPAILQGGTVYTVVSSDVLPTLTVDWKTATWSFDAGSDWRSAVTTVVERPDFSVGGAPIQFGFHWAISTTCGSPSGCNGGNLSVGMDNFSVTALAAPVPEPGQWAMLMAGVGLLAGVAMRRR